MVERRTQIGLIVAFWGLSFAAGISIAAFHNIFLTFGLAYAAGFLGGAILFYPKAKTQKPSASPN